MKLLSSRILVIILAGLVLLAAPFFHLILKDRVISGPAEPSRHATAPTKQEQTIPGLPVRLKIPEINVDAAIEQVGVTADGAMDITKSPDKVAWFKPGPRPGQNGQAIIAGHYGWQNGKAAAFDNLHKLQKGQKIFIEDDKGLSISFVVREKRRYDPNADTSGVFGPHDGKPGLNLITCEGAWNEIQKSYSKRLVVFADREPINLSNH